MNSPTELADILDQIGEHAVLVNSKTGRFKAKAYNTASKIIRQLDELDMDTIKQKLKENGMKNPKKVLKTIQDLIETGDSENYKIVREDKSMQALKNLTEIYGIGPKKAMDLYNKNEIFDVQQLKDLDDSEKEQLLTKAQRLGVQYFDDLQTRIDRSEIDLFKSLIEKEFSKLKLEGMEFSINGSYRRGAETSGDIDILLTGNDTKEVFTQVLNMLQKHPIFYVATLSKGKSKAMLLLKVTKSSPVRHVDIVITSKEEFPFAQLYFTGSGEFNVAMRGFAQTKGYTMNEHGIVSIKDQKKTKNTFKNEQDIFEFLELVYKEPHERIDKSSLEQI